MSFSSSIPIFHRFGLYTVPQIFWNFYLRNVPRECLLVLEAGIMGLKGGWNNGGEDLCNPLEVGLARNGSLWSVLY